MKSRTKKLYLASGNEKGLAWQLSVNISAKKPRWAGSYYMAATGKLHSQKTLWLGGGVVKGVEWQLSISISAQQDKQWGNFYFKPAKPAPLPVVSLSQWGKGLGKEGT